MGTRLVSPAPMQAETQERNNPSKPRPWLQNHQALPALLLMGVFAGLSHGNVENKGQYLESLFASQFPECFSNFSPSHSDAFVSLLPGNKQRGRVQSGSEQCPGTSLARLCPTGWEIGCFFSLALSSHAELGGLFSFWGFGGSRHLTMGILLPWATGLMQVTLLRV